MKESSLGKVLIDLGHITEEQLEEALMEQKINRGNASGREDLCHRRGQKRKLLEEIPGLARETRETVRRTMHAMRVNGR